MAKFTLPARKKEKKSEGLVEPDSYDPLNYMRSVRMPVSNDILTALQVGDSVEVKLVGKITGLESDEREKRKTYELTVDLSSVEVEDTSDFANLAD